MSKAISRRDFLKVTGAVGAAGLLAACGGNGGAASSTASSAAEAASVAGLSSDPVTRPLHFSRSAFIRTPHSTVSFPQCTMPATCGQPIILSTSKEASCL